MLGERFAFCQAMPLGRFSNDRRSSSQIADTALRGSGPDADGHVVRVAAVWTRDGRGCGIASGLTAQEVRTHDERKMGEGYLLRCRRDVALTSDGKPEDRHAAIWVERVGTEDVGPDICRGDPRGPPCSFG